MLLRPLVVLARSYFHFEFEAFEVLVEQMIYLLEVVKDSAVPILLLLDFFFIRLSIKSF